MQKRRAESVRSRKMLAVALAIAITVITATFAGAAQLAAQSPDEVSVLRERVTSKGGTTYAALTSMEQSGVKQAIIEAVKAASKRGQELGEQLGAGD